MSGGFIAGIKSLTGINQELVVLNKHLEKIVSNLNKVKSAAGEALSQANKVRANGTGQKGLGTSGNSQMADSLGDVDDTASMPSQKNMGQSKFGLYMANGGGKVLSSVAGGALGVAGAIMTAMPGMDVVGGRSVGYYQAAAGFNMNQRSLERATFSALGGAMSSTGSDAAVAALLSGRGYLPGSSNYLSATREIGGAFKFLGMANETAASAIAGMHSGPMAAKLYSYGINVTDPRTGKQRSTSEITRDLFKRMFPTGANAEQISRSMQSGYLGANLRGMGFEKEQQELIYRSMLDMGSGGTGDLASKKFGNTYLESTAKMATSETDLIMDKQDIMLKGFAEGADNVVALNKAMKGLPDLFFKLHGQLSAITSTNVGQGFIAAITALTGAVMGVVGGLLGMAGVKGGLNLLAGKPGMLSKLGSSGKISAQGAGASKALGATKALGAVGGLVGMGLSGKDSYDNAKEGKGLDWWDVGMSAVSGAATGFMFGGFAGAAIGAGVGVATNVGAYAAGGGFGGDGDLPGTTMPVGNASVSSPFGAPRTRNGQKTSHHGTDYSVPIGTPVKAARAGMVTFAGGSDGHTYGFHITIDHGDGWETLYGHLKEGSTRVRSGQTVAEGQVIALSGDTGNSTGPHLHFETRKNGTAQDPSKFLAGATSSSNSASAISGVLGASGSTFISVGISGVTATESTLSSQYGSQSAAQMLGAGAPATLSGSLGTASSASNSAGNTYGNAKLNNAGLLRTLYDAGFTDPSKLATAYAVVMAESGGRPNAVGDEALVDNKWGPSIGLFQIRTLKDWKAYNDPYRDISKLYDPAYNAKAGFIKSNGGKNWDAWSAYTNNSYEKFLPSKEELNKGLDAAGIPPMGGGSGASTSSFATVQRARASSVTSINHAGNTVNITVNVAQASEKEARYLASKVKEILQNDSAISAIGGQ